MKKVYKELDADQIARGVYFSSNLIGGGKIHELAESDDHDPREIDRRIKLLLDDGFFNDSPYKHNEVRATKTLRDKYNLY